MLHSTRQRYVVCNWTLQMQHCVIYGVRITVHVRKYSGCLIPTPADLRRCPFQLRNLQGDQNTRQGGKLNSHTRHLPLATGGNTLVSDKLARCFWGPTDRSPSPQVPKSPCPQVLRAKKSEANGHEVRWSYIHSITPYPPVPLSPLHIAPPRSSFPPPPTS